MDKNCLQDEYHIKALYIFSAQNRLFGDLLLMGLRKNSRTAIANSDSIE